MRGSGEQPRSRGRRSRLYATCVPGLARMLRRQLEAASSVQATGTGHDGRADIVFFDADLAGRAEALRSRLAEQVFAEIGRASRTGCGGPDGIASTIWRDDAVQRALSIWADEVRPLGGAMTFRVTACVLSERRFRRPDLRRAMSDVITADKPRWRFADPAQLEICVSEWHDGQYVAGLSLSNRAAYEGARRIAADRDGATAGVLPPTVAAAMVQLAGPPVQARQGGSALLDPCCGAGTILAEALAAGWTADGTDSDAGAVEAALLTAPGANVHLGDARELLLPDDCFGACVSWLPGRVRGSWQDWAGTLLAELSRVTRSGGSVVLLAPDLPRPALPSSLRLRRQVPIRLAGRRNSIWVFRRA
jgi:SAM-dependent methyltransferase